MLSLVGTAVAINPDADLRDLARERGWEIRDFRTARKAARIGVPSALALGAAGGALAAIASRRHDGNESLVPALIGSRRDMRRRERHGIAEDIIGTHYRYPDYFEVDREKIREFAARGQGRPSGALQRGSGQGIGYDALVASLTFLAVAGRKVQTGDLQPVRRADQHGAGPAPRPEAESSTGRSSQATSCSSTPTWTRSSSRTAPCSPRSAARSPTPTASPVITSIVTVIGEAAHDDEADEVSATINAATRRGDRENDCRAKL